MIKAEKDFGPIPRGPRDEVLAIYDKIQSIDPSAVEVRSHERMSMHDRTKAIRQLFKDLGIKHVSVVNATGSMCYWTYISLPRVETKDEYDMRYEADRHLEKLILAAFPGFADRSDTMSDYFDFVFMIR